MVKITFDDTPQEVTDLPQLRVTENAAKRIATIVEKDGREGLFLRVSVVGGGCSGFSYVFKLDTEKNPSDIIITHEDVPGVEIMVDVASMEYLKGSTVDFEETLEASQFIVKNPNAKSNCGCGSSFSV